MPLDVGATLPDLQLTTPSGVAVPPGKPTVLFFFKSTCPTCALALPYVDTLDRAFSDTAVDVWGVSQENLTVGGEFLDRCGVGVSLLDDSGLFTTRAMDVQNVPTTYLIDGEGRIQDVVIGLDKAGLNRMADTLAEWAGTPAPVVAPEDDGIPAWQPG